MKPVIFSAFVTGIAGEGVELGQTVTNQRLAE
jgi:hypothetical protein